MTLSIKHCFGMVAIAILFLYFCPEAKAADVCRPRPSKVAQRAAQERAVSVDRAQGYKITEIQDGVHWLTDGNFTSAIVTTGEGVILIDAPASLGTKLSGIVAELTDEPITHVIYSHDHADHIGGASELPGTATYIASRGAAKELATINRPSRENPFGIFVGGSGSVPSPTVIVDDAYTLKLGNKTLELKVMSSGHSHGDLVTYLPAQKVLVAIDFTWPASVPWIRLGSAVNVPGLIANNQQLLDYDFEYLVAGHVNSLGTRTDVELTVAYLKDLRASSISALQNISVAQVFQETGETNPYLLIDQYYDRLIPKAAEPVIKKWRNKLQGAGIWTCEHAQQMISSLRFDQAVER